MSWWHTVPGQILTWSAAVAGLAAGVKGLLYLAQQGRLGGRRLRDLAASLHRLLEIGTTDRWPNGSTSLPDAIGEIYRRQDDAAHRQEETHNLLKSYIEQHRAEHIDLVAGLNRPPTPSTDDDYGVPV